MTPANRSRTNVVEAPSTGVSSGKVAVVMYVTVFLLGALAFGIYVALAGQESDYDLLNYHYYNPYAFLNDRLDFDYAPAQLQTYLNPIAFVPLYVLIQNLKPVFVGIAYGAFHGLTFGLIFAISFRLFANREIRERAAMSLLAAVCGAYGPVFIATVGSSSSDALLNPLVLLGIYLVVIWMTSKKAPRAPRLFATLAIGGFMIGIASGLKLVEALYALGALLALGLGGTRWASQARAAIVWASGCAIGFVVSRGFWMYTLWEKFENPVFPFFNNVFRSPYYEEASFMDRNFLPGSFAEHLFFPFHFLTRTTITALTSDFRDSRYALIYVLLLAFLALAALRKKRRPTGTVAAAFHPAHRFLLVFFVLSYVLWQSQFSILRYAITLESLGGLVALVLVGRMIRSKAARMWAAALVSGVMILSMTPCQFPRSPWNDSFFPVRVPSFTDPSDVVVLIAHNRPFSFLVPYFQPGVRFVAVKNNFTKPHLQNEFQNEIRSIIDAHGGHLFLLAMPEDLAEDTKTLQAFNLAVTDTDYIFIEAPSESGLGLWLLDKEGI